MSPESKGPFWFFFRDVDRPLDHFLFFFCGWFRVFGGFDGF